MSAAIRFQLRLKSFKREGTHGGVWDFGPLTWDVLPRVGELIEYELGVDGSTWTVSDVHHFIHSHDEPLILVVAESVRSPLSAAVPESSEQA